MDYEICLKKVLRLSTHFGKVISKIQNYDIGYPTKPLVLYCGCAASSKSCVLCLVYQFNLNGLDFLVSLNLYFYSVGCRE